MDIVKKTVLVVDDSMFMRNHIKNILSKNDYHVIAEATNGHEAISLYLKVHPEIVLLDLILGEINGMTVLKELKKRNSKAKVVICSSMGQKHLIMEALKLGAKDFIVKPNFNELIPALDKIIS
jgi:two-component system, chemotaxis family, chemotaxis protein CheY